MEKKRVFGSSETVEKAKKGDSEAIAELFADYRPMLLRAVSASALGLAEFGYTAEDLMQEAGVAMSAAIRTYDGEKGVTFGAYARTCVRNRLISISRKVKRVRKSEQPADDRVEQTVLSADILDSLTRLLTPYEREVFTLIYSGYKPGEISCRLGRPVKSVYNAICRIKAKAKDIKA